MAVTTRFSAWLSTRRAPRLAVQWRRVFVFPTRHGFMVGLAVFGVFAIAVRIQNNMLLLMSIALFVIFLLSLIWGASNLDRLHMRPAASMRLLAGRAAQVKMRLDGRRALHDVAIATTAATRLMPASLDAIYQIAFTPERRGRVFLPNIRLETQFPFGLARAWTFISAGEVWAAPHPDFSAAQQFLGIGQAISEAQMTGGEGADGLDSWQPGTPLNRISWKHFAASDRLLQKTGEEGGFSALTLDYATVAHLGHERALSALCGALLQAADRFQPVHLILPEKQLRDLAPTAIDTGLQALAEA